MTKILTFISPKTSGASTVILNCALLNQTLQPDQKTAFLEISPWSSQGPIFKAGEHQHWGTLKSFLKTKEWNPSLLSRVGFDLGADLFFSPQSDNWSDFSIKFHEALLKLLRHNYDTIIIDLNIASGDKIKAYYASQSDLVVGVVSPDPQGLKTWENWSRTVMKDTNLAWVLNQVPAGEVKFLNRKFETTHIKFLGVLRTDSLKCWYHLYQAFPVVWHKRSRLKKDLFAMHSKIMETL